jgi:type 2 lantibiotic (TIGR03893 family)
MAKVDMKEIVGETFEDMSIAEMTMVQGSGDVDTETLSLLTVSAALSGAAATWAFTVGVVKTVKGKC